MRPPFPDDEPRRFDDDDEPRWRFSLTPGGLGLALFLVSLTVFFLAAIAGYVVVRTTNDHAPPWGGMDFPAALWVSTVVLVISGYTMHKAQQAAGRGVAGHVRLFLVTTLGLGILFLLIQTPALAALLNQHYEVLGDNVAVYGLTVVLIVVHGLHVVGGFVPLSMLTWRAMKQADPPPTQASLRLMAAYWHFLHVIWLLMFGVFSVLA